MKKLLLAFLLTLISSFAWANEYIIVVPFPPGGGTDTTARYIADRVNKRYGDKFVVVNKPGAAGMIGFRHVLDTAKNNPNVIYFGTAGTNVVEDIVNPENGASVARNSKTLIVLGKLEQNILALADSPYNSLADIKNANIGSYTFSTEALIKQLGLERDGNVIVPYKGEAPARLALLSKEIGLISDTSVMGDDFRSRTKIVARGNTVGLYSAYSFTVPLNFDSFKLSDLNTKINRVLVEPETKVWFESRGVTVMGGSPEEGDKFFDGLRTKFTKIVDKKPK